MKISACMIVKNEEKNIETCIKSYKNIVDEIIVVDTGSEDSTVQIAKRLGAKVFFYQWNNDFAAAKNFALEKAKGDWIIFLDADEYFTEESAAQIPAILSSLKNTHYNAVSCKLINIDTDDNKLLDAFLQIRIFKKDKNIKYCSKVHETLYNKKGKIHLISFYDKIQIYHTGYSSNINKQKAKRNLDILLTNIKENEDYSEYYRYLCDCYFSLDDYENALVYAQRHIESGIKCLGYESKIHKVMIDCLYKLGRPKKEVEEKIKEKIALFPDHPNFYGSYGLFLLDEKRYQEALDNLLLAIELNSTYKGIEVNFVIGIISFILHRIGKIYELMGEPEQALCYYHKSLLEDKYNDEAFQSLFWLIKNQPASDIIELINEIYDINKEKDVKFLVDELLKYKPAQVLAYYTLIWYKKFQHEDSALTFTMLAEGKYDTAFKLFRAGYLESKSYEQEILAVVSALLSDNTDNIKSLLTIVNPSLQRILSAYALEQTLLSAEDIDAFISIFKEMLLFKNDKAIDGLLNLKTLLPFEVISKIAKVYMDYQLYEEALFYYNKFIAETTLNAAYLARGYCYYRLGDYHQAQENFKQAIHLGYQENDVYEFMNWTQDRLGDCIRERS